MGESEGKAAQISLKDQGNEFFKAGNYLKAAALYTQAIKQDPSNPTLYSNRAAAFLNLVKLSKALADADTTITLKPDWEKGYFRKGCVLEAMERYEDALDAFQVALKYNAKSSEVAKKIKRLTQLAKDKKRAQEVETMRTNVDMSKHLDSLKTELSGLYGAEDGSKEVFSFLVETMENAVKSCHETSTVDPRVYFMLNKDKTDTEKYAPVVNIDKAFESPHTHNNCYSFLREYADDSFSGAACLVAPKSIISYPQVWKGQGSRKWKHGQSDGFFFQFESPLLRKVWFVSSTYEKGRTLCRDPVELDISVHEVLPRVFKQT
ncbi:PREDICTED: LOW QUALITY PROTEIN: serine/threonine-protein phosphatase 5 [Erythranthe guttata]|uniref:LOW QUALITY PROTEIN: serine/threonine-protein phosphatase 5 n=1 Tax=Erythranthe guttata TaxID=4155 RepID=UPI00064DFAEC|nr:PREDICTED: LOW QUALITY PROTEIN: serine/threonine-protein phosphatase 5 [Erythranthe guttata]|eukprot:XP_012832409.1 PREDICTED: LOW QUALITY PROTEIN: serine/threonine-protein phosphatase 5 [Erythranthe guttata]